MKVPKNVMLVKHWTTFSGLMLMHWHSINMDYKSSRKRRRHVTYNYSVESNGLLWLNVWCRTQAERQACVDIVLSLPEYVK